MDHRLAQEADEMVQMVVTREAESKGMVVDVRERVDLLVGAILVEEVVFEEWWVNPETAIVVAGMDLVV